MTLLPLAHGIGGIQDPPIPMWLAYYGGAAVLVLSFAALGALWRTPRLERERIRALVPLPVAALRVLLGAFGLALFVVVFAAALVGERSVGTNIAPTFIWVIFWLGLVPLTILFGNIWAWLNPWRAAADFVAWCWRRARLEWEPPFTLSGAARSLAGRVPPLLLRCAGARVHGPLRPADARARRRDLQLDHLGRDGGVRARRLAASRRGVHRLLRPDLPALDPDAARSDDSRSALRCTTSRATASLPARSRSSPSCSGRSRSTASAARASGRTGSSGSTRISGRSPSTSSAWPSAVAFVAAAYVAAVEVARRIGREQARLEQAFIGSLIPIAIAYVVAHYATFLLVQGQLAIPLASDPFGYGWDLFGTLDYRVNVQPLSADQIWYLQAGALVLGHVLGLVIAHDKALALFGSTKVALRTQYAMLALMVLYTVGGLWLLSRG